MAINKSAFSRNEFWRMKVLFVLLGFICSTQILYAYDFEVDGIYYDKTSNDEVRVTYKDYFYNNYSGALTIPEEVIINGTVYRVTSIYGNAFRDCRDLNQVTIPNSVIKIGERAFAGCEGLTQVTIPNSVTSIGDNAFDDCNCLTQVTIEDGTDTLKAGSNIFGNCPIERLYLGRNISRYSPYVYSLPFKGNTSLKILTIGNNVTFIDSDAFAGCEGLTQVTIPNSVMQIGKGAFAECISLISITVANNNSVYDSREGCNAIIETKSNTVITGCKSTIIPNTVTQIGDSAFYGCIGLTELTIPNSVTQIGESAFYGCIGLTELIIPNNVTQIGESAFERCRNIVKLTISNNVTAISDRTFYQCALLKTVTIPNSITRIGESAFDGCKKMTGLIIPNNVIQIGEYAFSGCSGLTELTIPNSVTQIGKNAFSRCSGIVSITVDNNNSVYDSREGCNAIIETKSNIMITGCRNTTIPDGVVKIGDRAFDDCGELTELIIPNSVTEIGEYAFSSCSGLTELIIPNSVTEIGEGAFSNCQHLTSLTISDNITEIARYTFSQCRSLVSITIPEKVKSIGYMAFGTCVSLDSIVSYIESPTPIDYSNFSYNYNNATLYVPMHSLELYQTTEGWNYFKNIVPIFVDNGRSNTLNVIDEQNKDLTEDVNIIWYDKDGKQIGTGSRLSGVADSTHVFYTILLDEKLGRIYREVKMQEAVASEDVITCKLEKIDYVTLEGRVSATDIDKDFAIVTVKQMLNGKYEETFTTQTNERGEFSVRVFDDETDITISRENCIDATLHRDRFYGNGNVGTIPISLISGFSILANVTYYPAVTADETAQETAWNDGLNNIEFVLTNKTKGCDITDFTIQRGCLIIKTGANIGDEIGLLAKSKQGTFADAVTTFSIENGTNILNLQLTELGGLDAICNTSNNGGTVGFLYDSDGVLVGKGNYIGETLNIRHLPNGVYTLVSMGNSLLLGNMTHVADMASVGMKEGKDYVKTRVEVVDGEVTEVSVSEVPRFDETQFYYTTYNTYFNTNKTSVTAGNYLTLSAHLDFKPENASKVNDVTLTIDLPDGCQMVDNSAIANRQPVVHIVDGNRVTMLLNKEQWQSEVRFCIMPTLNQNYTITAMASFDIDGQVWQPIGTAMFEVKGLSLNVPKYTADKTIMVNGTNDTAQRNYDINIYDNDVLIGKTTSKADGSWAVQCELYKPYTHSFHNIYAKIITENGFELTSETRQVEYDKDRIVPDKVIMLYYNQEFDTNYNIVFDLINGTTTPSSYYYFPYKNWPNWYETKETEPKDFTFLADFNINDTAQIKNVNIKVLNSDGTVRTLPATFDAKQNHWVAYTKYLSTNRLPKNATVEYDIIPVEETFDPSCIINDNNQYINLIKNYVTNIDTTKSEIIDANESMILCKYQTHTMDSPVFIRMEILDYDQKIKEFENKDYFTIEDNGVITNVLDSVLEGRNLEWIWNNENRTMIYVETSISNETSSKTPILHTQMKKAWWDDWARNPFGNSIFNILFNTGDIINIINDFNAGHAEYNHWLTMRNTTAMAHGKLYNETLQLIEAKCSDGTSKLSKYDYNTAKYYLDRCVEDAYSMRQLFKRNLDRIEKDLNRRRNHASVRSAGGVIIGSTVLNAKFTVNISKELLKNISKEFIEELLIAIGGTMFSNMLTSITTSIDTYIDNSINQYYGIDDLNAWYHPANKEIVKKYHDLQNLIKNSYRTCEQEKEDEKQEKVKLEEIKDEVINEKLSNRPIFSAKGTTVIQDPSGYVYEAVMSNRLEGVTATCYQMVQNEDMYGDVTENAIVWNAEDYSQQNPLKTDKTGFYRWDVPQGMWQVKYEKEGYETTYSDWLPVPPPQLDVNIGMKQSTPPTVTKMRGYESGINIEMAKYMRPETMTVQNITVTRNGIAEKGNIELLNAEQAPLGDEVYVSKVKFVPQNRFNTTDVVVVTVHQEVESYCGVKMTKDHVETVKIESEVTNIIVDNTVTIPYQGETVLSVQVLPVDAAAGKTVHATSSSPIIASVNASDMTINEDGLATFTLSGELPGGAVVDFTVDGTDIKAVSKIHVAIMDDNVVSTPVASFLSGETISNETLVTLSCSTEGATIYYTLDGSCPCDEQRRIKYVAPITLPVGQVTLQAIAVREGMADSDVALYEYTVQDAVSVGTTDADCQFKVDYHNGNIVISGAKGASCRIYDLQGRELVSSNRLSNQSKIKVPYADVYVVSVQFSDRQIVVQKVLAK